MLSTEAAAATARRLTVLKLPMVVHPLLYGMGTVKDFNWYKTNYPLGFLAIPIPRTLGTQGVLSTWAITVDAAGETEEAARSVAQRVQAVLLHVPRTPTAFEFLGDTLVGAAGNGYKYVLTFAAQLRQGE